MEKSNFEVALIRCWFCGENKGLIMNSRLTEACAKEIREANGKAIDLEPCDRHLNYVTDLFKVNYGKR